MAVPIKVLVVGGGCAGLTAASRISECHLGVDVILVEASDRLGGRVRQEHPFNGSPLFDIGGEFIHGDNTEAFKLAHKLGWEIQIDDGKNFEENNGQGQGYCYYTYANGYLLRKHGENKNMENAEKMFLEFIDTGQKLQKGAACSEDSALDFSESVSHDAKDELRQKDISLAEFLSDSKVTDSGVVSLVNAVYCQSEGVDINRMGILESSRAESSWPYGSGTYRLNQTYHIYLEYLINKCKGVHVNLNWQARRIDWRNDQIKVYNQNGDLFEVNHVIIAVPLNILKERDIEFRPELPPSKTKAIESMEMSNAVKMFCRFNERFWPSDMTVLYCEQPSPFEQIWTESSYETDGQCFYMLCGFATASLANQATKSSKQELKDRFLNCLDRVFGKRENAQPASDSFVDFYFYDWHDHPFIRGGYTSPVVGSHAMSIELAKAVEKKLFFAGEASNVTATSTVQAAVDSGNRAASEILEFINTI